MNTVVENYIAGLKNAYFSNGMKESWDYFERIKHGAAKEDMEKLTKVYPEIPDALISMLEYVDGTYWREYAGEKITLYFLGSDVEEYPYYLLSSREMFENQQQVNNYHAESIERQYDEVEIDDKITDKADTIKWLHFSDCSNNGGTSQLYIDFSPSATGKKGQVVRYLHDPDEFTVIADSFEAYLAMLMDKDYDFIREDL